MDGSKIINGKEYTWENIKCCINGVEIETLPISYESNRQEIHFEGRKEMINAIKNIGISVQYGIGDFPVSYVTPEGISVDENSVLFLKGIKRSEWLN